MSSWWWCLTHGRVEGSDSATCANVNRLGPYETHEQASRALERAAARTAEQDARDAAEDDGKR